MKTKILREKYVWILLLFSLIGLFPFFQNYFFGYDFVFQGARLASFYKNLQEGVILPRWAGQLNSGYGHPVLIFLYPFVFYLGSIFHFLGLSIVDSVKGLFVFGYIFSCVFMYFFGKKLWGERIGFLVAFVYLYSPYRFVNMYDRAALGEHMALAFLPLIFWSLTCLYQAKKAKPRHLTLTAVSFALTILSHNLIFLMSFPLIFAFWHYLIFRYRNHFLSRKTIFGITGFVWGLCLSAFFWMPVVFERRYTLYDQIANPEYYRISLLPLYQLFLSANYKILGFLQFNGGNWVYSTLSPIQWLIFLAGIYFVVRFWKFEKR